MDESNTWRVQSKEIASILVNFYKDLFTTSNPNPQWAPLDHIPMVIIKEMNLALTSTFREAEPKKALKQMYISKLQVPMGCPRCSINIFGVW